MSRVCFDQWFLCAVHGVFTKTECSYRDSGPLPGPYYNMHVMYNQPFSIDFDWSLTQVKCWPYQNSISLQVRGVFEWLQLPIRWKSALRVLHGTCRISHWPRKVVGYRVLGETMQHVWPLWESHNVLGVKYLSERRYRRKRKCVKDKAELCSPLFTSA